MSFSELFGAAHFAGTSSVNSWVDFDEARASLERMGLPVSDQQFIGLRQSWQRTTPLSASKRRLGRKSLGASEPGSWDSGVEVGAHPSYVDAAVRGVLERTSVDHDGVPPSDVPGSTPVREARPADVGTMVSFSSPELGRVSPSFSAHLLASPDAIGFVSLQARRAQRQKRRDSTRGALPAPQHPQGGLSSLKGRGVSLHSLGSSEVYRRTSQRHLQARRQGGRQERPSTAPAARSVAHSISLVRVMPAEMC